MKRNLSVSELLSECKNLDNRKVNIVATVNDNNFSTTYSRFGLKCSDNIDWDGNSYLVLDNYGNEDDKAQIKIGDIKSISLDESSLGEIFDVYAIECDGFLVQLCLDECVKRCIDCGRVLDYQDRCFTINGTGNYYTEGLDNCKVQGYICSDCLSKIIGIKDNEKGLSVAKPKQS